MLKQRPAAQTLTDKVDELFAELDENWMPGATVVVLQDGEIVHSKTFGMADLEGNAPLTVTSMLQGYYIAILRDEIFSMGESSERPECRRSKRTT